VNVDSEIEFLSRQTLVRYGDLEGAKTVPSQKLDVQGATST
jgi:hypothetical protein